MATTAATKRQLQEAFDQAFPSGAVLTQAGEVFHCPRVLVAQASPVILRIISVEYDQPVFLHIPQGHELPPVRPGMALVGPDPIDTIHITADFPESLQETRRGFLTSGWFTADGD